MTDNNAPGAWPVLTPGAWLAGFIKRTFIHCYIQNMKALGLVVSKKIFFYVFPIVSLWELMTPRLGPFLTPGAWLAGFIKRTIIHWRRHFYVFPIIPPGRACMDPKGTVGRIYKEHHYTLLHTKYESSGPCGFGEDFFVFFPCKSMGAICCHGYQSSDPTWPKT